MSLGFVGQVAELLSAGPEGQGYASMSIAAVDPTDLTKNFGPLPERAFQYWPGEISDTVDVGWNFQDLPGASHALAQWMSNGGRTISFEVHVNRIMKPVDDRSSIEKTQAPTGAPDPASELLKDQRPHNVDVRAEIQYLRGYTVPVYKDVDGRKIAYGPPIGILNVPNFGLNGSGGDAIFVVMTGCDVTYKLAFPNGVLRHATVALTFREIVQKADGVYWRGWDGTKGGAPAPYVINSDEGLAPGGGRGTAGLNPGKVL